MYSKTPSANRAKKEVKAGDGEYSGKEWRMVGIEIKQVKSKGR